MQTIYNHIYITIVFSEQTMAHTSLIELNFVLKDVPIYRTGMHQIPFENLTFFLIIKCQRFINRLQLCFQMSSRTKQLCGNVRHTHLIKLQLVFKEMSTCRAKIHQRATAHHSVFCYEELVEIKADSFLG